MFILGHVRMRSPFTFGQSAPSFRSCDIQSADRKQSCWQLWKQNVASYQKCLDFRLCANGAKEQDVLGSEMGQPFHLSCSPSAVRRRSCRGNS